MLIVEFRLPESGELWQIPSTNITHIHHDTKEKTIRIEAPPFAHKVKSFRIVKVIGGEEIFFSEEFNDAEK